MSGLRTSPIVLVLTAAFCCAGVSANAADAPAGVRVPVAICDKQGVPQPIVENATRLASDVYREIGVSLEWIDAGCAAGEHSLTVNMVRLDEPGLNVTSITVGFAEPGTSVATVIYDRVESFSKRYHVKREVLLGYAIAHEIGHLLLPPNSHSREGLMRPSLNMEQASARRLRFTKEQAELIVRKIETPAPSVVERSPIALATH